VFKTKAWVKKEELNPKKLPQENDRQRAPGSIVERRAEIKKNGRRGVLNYRKTPRKNGPRGRGKRAGRKPMS